MILRVPPPPAVGMRRGLVDDDADADDVARINAVAVVSSADFPLRKIFRGRSRRVDLKKWGGEASSSVLVNFRSCCCCDGCCVSSWLSEADSSCL